MNPLPLSSHSPSPTLNPHSRLRLLLISTLSVPLGGVCVSVPPACRVFLFPTFASPDLLSDLIFIFLGGPMQGESGEART